MKFTAVGDVLCQRRLPQNYDGFAEIRDFIMQGDARFFNLETTLNYEGEFWGNQYSGGTYIRCTPEVYYDMLDYGFNMVTANNNHALDFGHGSLMKTIECLDESGITHAGLGRNLHEAAAPAYLETANGRVALISINTSFNPAMRAGEQSRRLPGRPGINGLTVSQKIMVPDADFEAVKRIGELSGVNDPRNITRAEGYYPWPAEGTCELGPTNVFVKGDRYEVIQTPNKDDLERLKSAIREANKQADYVIVSIHTHQIVGKDKTTVPPYFREMCHALIDEGADAIISHGPHLLRAIEVYEDKPIFYSLGDFLIQLYNVSVAPEDFYKNYGMNSNSSVIELLEKRSAGFTRGLMEDDAMLETVIPYWECDENKKLTKLTLMPVKASKKEGKMLEGLPRPAKDLTFIERLAKMSEPYGVKISVSGGVAECKW